VPREGFITRPFNAIDPNVADRGMTAGALLSEAL
jgi:hypothetical protein